MIPFSSDLKRIQLVIYQAQKMTQLSDGIHIEIMFIATPSNRDLYM